MESIRKYKIDVEMALSGSKSMQKKMEGLLGSTADLRKRFSDLGIDKIFSKQLESLEASAASTFAKLENIAKEYKKAMKDGDTDLASGAVIDTYKETLDEVSKLIINLERLSQVSKNSFAAQEEDLQKTITLLDKNGIKIKNMMDLYVQASTKAEAANSAAPLAKLNKELDSRAQKLLKIKDLLGTMKTLNLDSKDAKNYETELQKIYLTLQDFNVPLKEAEAMMKGLKVNPKLLADMQDFSKYTKGLKTDLVNAQNAMDKNSTAYKEMGVFLKQISIEQGKIAKGGRDEFAVAKKNIKLIEDRFAQYKLLNRQADTLSEYLLEHENLTKGTRTAISNVVDELRLAAVEQFNLTKGSREYNDTMKKALAFEAELNKDLKEKVATETKLLSLRTKMKAQQAELNRMASAKQPYATAEALKAAREQAAKLEGDIKNINALIAKVHNIGTIDGKVDVKSLSRLKDETRAVTKEFTETNLKIKEVKANLSQLSSTKWGTNILKRAVAYASMYAGIYEVISLMRNGIGSVVEFDTQMRTIEAVFDVTSGTAKNLTQDLLNLGRAWGGSVTDINDAALALGRAGIATEKVAEATEVVIKMAKLTGDSIAVSASAVITYQQVFGATHPVLKEVGDQLAYVANQSRLSTQDIGTFSNYALAAASAAGISMEAINAMATSFSNAGVNASTIGTQIRRFSSLMKDNSTAAVEFFQKLGTTQEAFSAQMQKGKKSADEAMTWIATRLKSLSNSEFQKTIKGMDILASNSITLLRNNADEFLRHFTALNEGVQGEIDKANLISDGYQASFEKMKVAASDAFIALSETAAPVIKKLMDDMARFFDYIKNNSGVIVEKINTIIDVAKWTLMAVTLFKVVNAFDNFRKSTSLANVAVVAFAGRLGALATAFWAVTAGIRAFLATNPIGWAILGVTAVGSIAASMMDYGDEVETATQKQKKFNDLQSQAEAIDKRVQTNREELGNLMKVLNDATHEATDAEYARAAALEASISKDQESIKLLREKQKVSELKAQVKVKQNRQNIITQEIKLAEADGNIRLMQNLERRHDRLQKEIGTIKVKVGFAEAKSNYINDVKDLVRNYEAEFQRLDKMRAEGAPEAKINAWVKVLDVYKTRLKDVYNLDIEMFKGKDLEVELEKYLNTVKGKLAASELYLKLNPKVDAETRAALEHEISTLKDMIANNGASANDLFAKVNLDTVAKYGQAVANQFKAGMNVEPQFDSFIAQYEDAMDKITTSTTFTASNLNLTLQKEIDKLDVSAMGEEFLTLIDKIKQAEADFAKADTAKQKQQATTDLNNALAEMQLKYKGVADEAISAAQNIANHYNTANNNVQSLSGELGKVTKAVIGNGEAVLKQASKWATAMQGIQQASKETKYTYSEIVEKLATGADISEAIKNSNLSANDAKAVHLKLQAQSVVLENTLLQLAEAYAYVLNNPALAGEKNRQAILADLQKQMIDAASKAENLANNMKGVNSHIKASGVSARKLARGAESATKAAEKHAEQVERSQRALKKLEAGYRALTGDYKMSYKLDFDAEIMKIEEMGKKAEASKAKIQELKQLFLEGKSISNEKDMLSTDLSSFGSSEVSAVADIRKKYEEKLIAENEYFQKRLALIDQQESIISEKLKTNMMTQAEYEEAHRQLELQKHAEYRAQQYLIDQQYYTNLASQAEYGLSGVITVMDNLQKAGIIKSKAWMKVMQGLQVAKAIMTTYQNAVLAYAAGLEAGGPAGPALGAAYAAVAISAGMAQVAQIKAQKFHTGGYTDKPLSSGVGGLKDDEINAVLKKGEYVLTQNEVASIKAANKRNTGAPVPSEKQDTNKSDSPSLQTRELAQLAESMKSEVVIVNSQDPAVIEDWATSRRGREVINNIING